MAAYLQTIIIAVTVITCAVIIAGQDWRWQLLALAVVSLLEFTIFASGTPIIFPVILLIIGWMACAILGTTKINREAANLNPTRSEIIFRLLAFVFYAAVAIVLAQKSFRWFPGLDFGASAPALIMIFTGLMLTSYSASSHQVIIGLLILVTGFEIIYLSLELSLLVMGLLGAIKIGLGFIGSFWLASLAEEQPK